MEALRFGIIGVGGIATNIHLPAMAQIPQAKLVAVADVLESRAKSAAERFGAGDYYSDHSRLLARPDIDAVIVSTWHPFHAPIAIQVLEAGKHVLVQKPMATRQEDADRLVEVAASSGRIAMALPFSFSPAYLKAQALIREGAIGRVVMARARVAHSGPGPIRRARPGEDEQPNWFYLKEKAVGGAIFDMGVYAISAISGLVSPIKTVMARTSTVLREVDVEENAVIVAEFRNGAIGTVETSWDQQASDEQITVYGAEGTIILRSQIPSPPTSGAMLLLYSQSASFAGAAGWVTVDVPQGEARMVDAHRHWVESVLEGRRPLATVEQGRHVVEVMLGAYRSAETGQLVEIASTF